MTSILYYISLPVYWIFGILYPIYQSYKAVEARGIAETALDESTQGISAQKSTGGVSHWVNFWIVSNLMHLITGILEHGSPENMPAFYIIFKMVALVYLPLAESDLSGKFLECCVTPFFKPLVPEIDSAFNDVMNELTTKSSKLFDMAKTKASAKRGALPRKPSPPAPSSS